jgi:hypothetical protein
MADSYYWLAACETGTGLSLAESFKRNLEENVRGFALETTLGEAIRSFLQTRPNHSWTGTAAELHDVLRGWWDNACDFNVAEMKRYPANGRILSGRLNEAGASLRANGIAITQERSPDHDGWFGTFCGSSCACSVPCRGNACRSMPGSST